MVERSSMATRRGVPGGLSATPTGKDVVATFCFIDIAGYTALTDSHGEHAAADLVEAFTRMVRAAVAGRGRLQELTGDSAFLVFADPPSAIAAIAHLYQAAAGQWDFPALRTGLHHGRALYRSRRYFGSTINLAARTCAQAAGGEILCTNAVAAVLSTAANAAFTLAPLGTVRLRNLPRDVELHAVNLPGLVVRRALDPVCQMLVDKKTAATRQQFQGRTYWFCSAGCADRFTVRPQDFVDA